MKSDDVHASAGPANGLANETSPYLLQHAYNPVQWHPWSPEAIALARREQKPIFLSIGYSTCYWCHVMERECFESEAIARLMNEYFICIKVDREERPDVDDIYMTAVQIMTGSGGWPLSVWLTPDSLEPFYGGTYFPPEDMHGRAGFPRVLQALHQTWIEDPQKVREQAVTVSAKVRESLAAGEAPANIGRREVESTVAQFGCAHDQVHAGFSSQGPKFPMPVNHEFLIEAGWDVPAARAAVLHALERMALGGMYDQVGGGFHRYSVDEQWLVPHFEKMLYDNAMLASVYVDAYELTGDEWYADIAMETLDWVLREMTSEDGSFFSALDAESNAREGESYLWTPDQIRSALEAGGLEDDVEFTLELYGLDRGTNFQDPHHPGDPPTNVLFRSERPEAVAGRLGMDKKAMMRRSLAINAALLAARDQRDQPRLDDKVIVAWNGLMIGGMADAGRTLFDQRYVEAANAAADDIMATMWSEEGGLLRTKRGGEAHITGFLEDYAYMIRGLLRLHEATEDPVRLTQAIALATQARARFWDDASGGWYETLDEQDDLFVRGRSLYDGALPSANAVMLNNMIALHERTGEQQYADDFVAGLRSVSGDAARSPRSVVHSIQALHRAVTDHPELIGGPAKAQYPDSHVRLRCDTPSLELGPGESVTIEVILDIESGWHVNAHQPAGEFGPPLSMLSLDEGLSVEPAYPPGHSFEGPAGRVLVYDGTVVIPVVLTRVGELPDGGRLAVTWQACDDQVCLQPMTMPVPVEIRSKPGF